MRNGALVGRSVLLLEDEMLVSVEIEDFLIFHGCIIVGPFYQVPEALSAARTAMIDVAILDINIAGTRSYDVAETLYARGVPFFFLSGYGQTAVPSNRPDWHICRKPFTGAELLAALEERLT